MDVDMQEYMCKPCALQAAVPHGTTEEYHCAHAGVKCPESSPVYDREPGQFDQSTGVSLVQTVEENKKFYTPRQFDRAKKARELLHALGSPTVADLKKAIKIGIKNSPVTFEDVIIAEKIFGQDVGSLKGKSTRTKPAQPVQNYIEIPP